MGKRNTKHTGFTARKVLFVIAALLLGIWLNNTSLLVKTGDGHPEILAHRGLGQTFDVEGVKWNTNTAAIIHDPEHPYLENTIEGIRAAIQSGADLVEFDVRLTKDKQLAVFHDFLLEYRTNGRGAVSEHTMQELRKLDVGYGYTADGGVTYPFRGKGIGKMPSAKEVLHYFPQTAWLIHIKDGGMAAAKVLESYLLKLNGDWQKRVSVYDDETAVRYFRDNYVGVRTLTKSMLKTALIHYLLLGWTGYVPESIRSMEVHIPASYAWLLWGWPDKFLQRMDAVNTRVVLVKYVGGWSDGFDSEMDLEALPRNYNGCIWTNRVDAIGPILKK